MRPFFFLLLALSVAASANPIMAGAAIPLTGGGFWYSDPADMIGNQSVSAGGDNGVDSVSFSYTSTCLGAAGPNISVSTLAIGCAYGTALLDGVSSSYFSAFVSGGTGSIDVFDSGGDLLASADLIGWINVTSISYSGLGDRIVNGTFIISPVPEPATFLLMALGFVACIVKKCC